MKNLAILHHRTPDHGRGVADRPRWLPPRRPGRPRPARLATRERSSRNYSRTRPLHVSDAVELSPQSSPTDVADAVRPVMYSLFRAPASARDIGGEGRPRDRAAGRGSWGARAHAHDNNRNTRPSPPPPIARPARLREQEHPRPSPPHCVGSPSGFDTVSLRGHCQAASLSSALRVRQPHILDRLAGPRGDAVEVGARPQAAELVEQIGRRCAHGAA